jgi:predicted phage gp36 major capsid-like protein
MLSHLVGAANRADIRRLRQLEAENAQLEAKVARQQKQLRNAAVARDAAIRELTRELENHLTRGHRGVVAFSADPQSAIWESLAADLKRRAEISESRRRRAEGQLQESRSDLAADAMPVPRSNGAKASSSGNSMRSRRAWKCPQVPTAPVGPHSC